MRIVFSLLFIIIFSSISAQNNDTFLDSLNKKLSEVQKPDEKFKILMKISDYWSYRDTAMAFSAIKQAEPYIKDEYTKGLKYFYKAGVYFDKDIDASQQLYLKAEPLIATKKSTESYEYRARLWHNYGVLEQIKGNGKQLMDITLKKCIPFAEKSNNNTLLAGYHTDIGILFFNIKEYEKAIHYYKKAISILDKDTQSSIQKGETTAWAYINLAETYLFLKQNIEALHSIEKAEKALVNIPQSQYNVLIYKVKSRYYISTENITEALTYIEKGISFAQKMGLEYDEQSLSYEKFRLYRDLKQYSEAKQVLISLLENKKFFKNKKNHLIYLNDIASLEYENKNYKEAFEYLKKFQVIYDSLTQEDEKTKIISLESKFKNKEQQTEIQYLKSKNYQQKIIFWISSALIIIIAFFIIYTYRQRKKHNEQKLLNIQKTKEIEVKQALTDGENKERERISKELHDGIGGKITGIKISLEHLAREQEDEKLLKAINSLDEAVSEVRLISKNLAPITLLKYGLEEAIKDLCQNSQNDYCKIYFYSKNLNIINDKVTQMHIYRILQESVSNAIKHSEASKIIVQCTYEPPFLLMEIEDNGKGFNPETVSRNLGLNNIEKRVIALNGKLTIESALQKGTTINIECNI